MDSFSANKSKREFNCLKLASKYNYANCNNNNESNDDDNAIVSTDDETDGFEDSELTNRFQPNVDHASKTNKNESFRSQNNCQENDVENSTEKLEGNEEEVEEEDNDEYDDNLDETQSNVSMSDYVWNIINPDKLKLNDYIPADRSETSLFDLSESENHATNIALNTNTSSCVRTQCHCLTFYERMSIFFWRTIIFSARMTLKFMKFIRNILILIYFLFILACNLPFAVIRNLYVFLKCLTGGKCVTEIVFRLPYALWGFMFSVFQASFICKHKVCHYTKNSCRGRFKCLQLRKNQSNSVQSTNSNLNNSCGNVKKDKGCGSCCPPYCADPKKCFMTIAFIFVVYLMYTCHTTPENNMCRVKSLFHLFKAKLLENLTPIYLLPGADCIKAGRCCRGTLESIFRWLSCFLTIPIRIILSIWPKHAPPLSKGGGLRELKMYIDKIIEEIEDLKSELAAEEDNILIVQTVLIDLEQKVSDKSMIIHKIKPKLKRSAGLIDKLYLDLQNTHVKVQSILSIRADIDKMVDMVRQEAHDSAALVRGTVTRLKTSLEAEHHRLKTQITTLEKMVKEESKKAHKRNARIIQRLQQDIEHLRALQAEIKKKIIPLQELPKKYAELSDYLIRELRNKMAEEMGHHEQMTKRTEKFCQTGVEKLEATFDKAKFDLTCYINKTLMRESKIMMHRLTDDIRESLHERTVELSRKTVDQAIENFLKSNKKKKQKLPPIKKCSLFDYVFGYNPPMKINAFNDKQLNQLCISENQQIQLAIPKPDNDELDEIIERHLTIFSADQIGLPDFALESSGGEVITELSSPSYTGRAAFLSLFGVTFGKVVKSIRKIIQVGSLPGECWAYEGDKGHVTIKLVHRIIISAITIDHVDKRLTPNGNISSAPKIFHVYGMKSYDDLKNNFLVGIFEFNKNGNPIQTFKVDKNEVNQQSVQYIRFDFLSNHGNDEYTCIYRIRVHGNFPVDNN